MSQRLSRIALPVLSVSSWAISSRSRSISPATASSSAARSEVGVRGQSVRSNAWRAAAIAAWTWSSVATSTSVTTEPSDGFTTGLHSPLAEATHSPLMKRLGTAPSRVATMVRDDGGARMVPAPGSVKLSFPRVGPRPGDAGPRARISPHARAGSTRQEDGTGMSALPDRANVVVIGAGIVGNSVAYHLALAGWRDIVLLDKGTLPNPAARPVTPPTSSS